MLAHFATIASLLRWLIFPLAAYVLALRYARRAIPPVVVRTSIAGTVIIILAALLSIVTATHYLQQWDFISFWLYGHAAIAHDDVYDPATYRALTTPIPIDADFRREIIDVGFPYPPPTILLFVPLGFFTNVTIASALWLVAFLAALTGGVVVLARTYARNLDPIALCAVAGLAFALPASADNVAYHQTSFLAFLFVAATFRLRETPAGGIAAGLAVVVKPYLAIILLWFALRRRWNALAASILTLAAATLVALPFLGHGALHAFLFANSASRQPPIAFAESEIASLYAEILRTFHRAGSFAGPVHDPIFVAIALVLFALSLFFISTARTPDDDLSLPIALTLGLMLYPGTSSAYAIVLIPALAALARRAGTPRLALLFAGAAAAFFAANAGGGAPTFAAFGVLWVLLAAIVVRYPSTDVRPA